MKRIICLIALLPACASSSPAPIIVNAAPIDNVDAGNATATSAPDMDGGNHSYDPCVQVIQQQSSNPRLLEQYCIDSFGEKYFWHYRDTKLNINCDWLPAADTTRCLPDNQQTAFFYTDEKCSIPIAFAETDNDQLTMPYVGLAIFGDTETHIDIYRVGNAFTGNEMYVKYEGVNGSWDCLHTYLAFKKAGAFFVGAKVSPSLFVPEN